MTVTILNPVGTVGGAERVLLAWAVATGRLDPAPRLTAVLLADGPLRHRLTDIGVSVEVVPLPDRLAAAGDTGAKRGGSRRLLGTLLSDGPDLFAFARRLGDAIARHRPAVIHSHGLKTHLLAALAGPAGVPVVWHLHDFYSERPLAKWAIKAARRSCTVGVAISDAVRADFARVLPGAACVTVRNTTDPDHFAPDGDVADLDALAELPPAPSDTVRVGLVATYANWKGHGVFLDALAKLSAQTAVRGYVVGGPIYATAGSQVSRGELEQRASNLGLAGRAGFVPFQPDPAPVYRALDVVVHASTRPEPFGLTIAEGMSCGRAVVVSAAGGAAELFRDGIDAIGFPPGDSAAFTRLLTALVADPALRARLGQEARRTALRDFAPHRLPAQVEAVYRCARRWSPVR